MHEPMYIHMEKSKTWCHHGPQDGWLKHNNRTKIILALHATTLNRRVLKTCSTYHTPPVTCHWCRRQSPGGTCHSAGTCTSRGLWSRCSCAQWSTGCWRGRALLAVRSCRWLREWVAPHHWPEDVTSVTSLSEFAILDWFSQSWDSGLRIL